MVTSINPPTPQLNAVKNFFDAYLTLDLNNVEPFVSKDFQYQTFPKIADHPDEMKGAHFERYAPLFSLLTNVETTYHEVIEAPGKVVVHASAMCSTVDGTQLDYDSVAIVTLVEEDGQLKIANFKDFADPEKRNKIHSWAAKTLAKRAT